MEFQMRNWVHLDWLSGDHIVEQAVHSIDKINWLMRNEIPISATGMGGREMHEGPERGNDYDHFAIVYEYADGKRAHLHCRQMPFCYNDNNDYIVGTDGNFTNFEINEHLKSLIATRFTDTVGEANLPIELYAANTTELSDTCKEVMQPEFDGVGISLERFFIENVSMPEELKKEIFEYSRLDKLDLDKLTKFKTAKAIEAAANSEGGTAGAGMGMGMGFAMAQQMGAAMAQPQQVTRTAQPQQPTGATPPPMPAAIQYYYAVNGAQQGPATFEQLQSLYASRTINRNSLVWKQGMTEWKPLSEIEELRSFLGGNTPPPLPPQ